MSSNTNNEGEIRKALIEADRVECMVALPGQLFTNTQIPACIWFLTRNKGERDGYRSRNGETLFIDARNLGYMKDRVLRNFSPEDIAKAADTFHAWKKGEGYEDVPGFCKAARTADIKKYGYVLTPGRYVGAPPPEDDGIPFEEKMAGLTATLKTQFAESAKLEGEIRKNLAGLGYEI
jgi:type I restriction enzyme M protein